MPCRDCKHWEREWYSEEWDQWCGYGCHNMKVDGEYVTVNIGICLLAPKATHVRLEVDTCELFEGKESAVDDDVSNMLFGEADD